MSKCMIEYTVDREIFTLKIICAKNFCGVKFLQFGSIREMMVVIGTSAWSTPSI